MTTPHPCVWRCRYLLYLSCTAGSTSPTLDLAPALAAVASTPPALQQLLSEGGAPRPAPAPDGAEGGSSSRPTALSATFYSEPLLTETGTPSTCPENVALCPGPDAALDLDAVASCAADLYRCAADLQMMSST